MGFSHICMTRAAAESVYALQAVAENREDVVKRLAQSNAKLTALDGHGNTALHLAVRCKVVLLVLGLTMMLS